MDECKDETSCWTIQEEAYETKEVTRRWGRKEEREGKGGGRKGRVR